VKVRGKKCLYGPFKYKIYLIDHMRKAHLMFLPKVKLGPKVAYTIKKGGKRSTKVVNSKAMNFKVMTIFLKRARKEFWRKSKQ